MQRSSTMSIVLLMVQLHKIPLCSVILLLTMKGFLSSSMAPITHFIGFHFGYVLVHFKGHKKRMLQCINVSFSLVMFGYFQDVQGMHLKRYLYTFNFRCMWHQVQQAFSHSWISLLVHVAMPHFWISATAILQMPRLRPRMGCRWGQSRRAPTSLSSTYLLVGRCPFTRSRRGWSRDTRSCHGPIPTSGSSIFTFDNALNRPLFHGGFPGR